jgi:type III restriction enzyme
VKVWRQQGWPGTTNTTAALLRHWTAPGRERRLFFCQLEAVETAIYLAEIAPKQGDAWIENSLRQANENANPGLYRIAFKMATGSGKTVVMGMLIAWQVLNKLASSQDARFSDAFLIVTPGITIRDRLRVLLPSDPESYYRQLDLAPADLLPRLGEAKIVVTNFHAFLLRETLDASKLTKQIVTRGRPGAFSETPDQMVRRVCRELGTKRGIVVLNDEAHHCYRSNPNPKAGDEENSGATEKLTGDEKREAKQREVEARVWISGLEAIQRKLGIRALYDLSATPFFLRGSGYDEGTIFPWVVSDFSLIDAIEAGIVKVPRVPVADDAMVGDQPTYRNLWQRIRADLPKKGRATEAVTGAPVIPAPLEGALKSLYGHYKKAHDEWEANEEARERGLTPPVFIVVCQNTNISKLVYDYVAGYEKEVPGAAAEGSNATSVAVPGQLEIFSNVVDGRFTHRPATILVDSSQLESGEGMSPEWKRIAAREIDEWKAEYRQRFPGRDPEQLTDEDLLREVMNTVGKAGKLGEQVKCVVSVSMLTEGWDANTVTHILGVRAFGTQLLCEQVVGRGLRRMSYATNDEGRFDPEYAEVYGVPFSFIPTSGDGERTKVERRPTRVRALPERAAAEITFPRVRGYRQEMGDAPLRAAWSDESRLTVTTADVPSITENAPIVGLTAIHDLGELRRQRRQTVEFELAKRVAEHWFAGQPWRFPELARIARTWLDECLTLGDNVFVQYLLFASIRQRAAEKIYRSIPAATGGSITLKPILAPFDTVGSTRWVEFDTRKDTYATSARCHVSHVVLDSGWEAKMASTLESMPEVVSYVKNQRLGFAIPYVIDGDQRSYLPDYLVRIDDGRSTGDLLNLIVEVTGEKKPDKEAKVQTARDLWVPAVNNEGAFGRWAYVEILNPWKCEQEIRDLVLSLREDGGDGSKAPAAGAVA